MCELLALNANQPADITFSFAGLMERGGKTAHHKDGWGISFYEGKGCRLFVDPISSCHSELAKFVKTFPIKSKIIISHIRKANSGKVSLENTHPFSRELWGRHWTFAHNGQLRGIKTKLKLQRFLPVGTTDSEHAFCWLLEQISKKYPKPPVNCESYCKFLYGLCKKLASYGTFNILLSDSKHLFAFCSTKLSWLTRKAPFGHAHLKDAELSINFSEKNSTKDIISIIATEPLTDNEYWYKMSKNEFHIFKNGVSIQSYRECNQE